MEIIRNMASIIIVGWFVMKAQKYGIEAYDTYKWHRTMKRNLAILKKARA